MHLVKSKHFKSIGLLGNIITRARVASLRRLISRETHISTDVSAKEQKQVSEGEMLIPWGFQNKRLYIMKWELL